MLISKNWLEKFVTIPKKVTPESFAELLTVRSVEVEEVTDLAKKLDGIIVAKIIEIFPHNNADKLQVTKVDTGSEVLQVVCGAKNIEVGQHVPFATVGTFLPAVNMTIAKRDVRGVESNGMLCAADELGLGSDHAGILVLDSKSKLGTPVAQVLGLQDWTIEVDNKSLTHRPDMWGHYGVAREVAAMYKTKLKEYSSQKIKNGKGVAVAYSNKDKKACLRYVGVALDNVQVTTSPAWLINSLRAIGVESINNVVDASNYVMYELGQPTHTFNITGKNKVSIQTRKAKPQELFTSLDGAEHELTHEDLVIEIDGTVSALAGVIGGKESGITETSTRIFIESANFDHVTIRKTSSRHQIRTQASVRFEKSLDPELCLTALERVVEIIKETSPQTIIASEVVNETFQTFEQPKISTSVEYFQKFLGAPITAKEVEEILTSLGFIVKMDKKGGVIVVVPTWRATKDVSMEQDLGEEVARMYGYENIKPSLPSVALTRPLVDYERRLINQLTDILAYGFDANEILTYSFIGLKEVELFGEKPEHFVAIKNPVAVGEELCRRELLPRMILESQINMHTQDAFGVFEIGKVFRAEESGPLEKKGSTITLPGQDKHIAYACFDKKDDNMYAQAKNVAEVTLHRLRLNPEFVKLPVQTPWLHPHRTRYIKVGQDIVGVVSELHPEIAKKLKIKGRIGVFEMNITKIANLYSEEYIYKSIPKYPSISLDISMLVDKVVEWDSVLSVIASKNNKLVEGVELFDVYSGENVAADKKSIAFRITYRDQDKTLELSEAEALHNEFKKELTETLGAVIR